MSKISKSKIILGVASGLALGYWLNSEHGKRVRNEVYKSASDLGENVQSTVAEQAQVMRHKAESLLHEGVSVAQDTLGSLEEKMNVVQDDVENSFEKGKKQARAKLKELEKELS